MVNIQFKKFQGTGNDFIILDNLTGCYDNLTTTMIQKMCDRKYGIGADGLIKINASANSDFYVDYYNSDGSKSFCGNGARCAVVFANGLGLIKDRQTEFEAIDGKHTAELLDRDTVKLKMGDVTELFLSDSHVVMHTGSPHYIEFGERQEGIVDFGRSIRYSPQYNADGINVNLVQVKGDNELYVETYERGVEDETLSCGTGVTACALAYMDRIGIPAGRVIVHTKGGDLEVEGIRSGAGFNAVYLIGPAKFVFEGTINME